MPLMTSTSQIKGFAQSGAPSVIPEGSLWYDTANDLLKSSDGSTFNQVGKTSFASAAVVSQSTTIGDYTTPTSATASSVSLVTADTNWGISRTLTKEQFLQSNWSSQANLDAAWISDSTVDIRATYANERIDATMTGADAGSTYHMYRDMTGAVVSDTTFIFRGKLVITTVDTVAGGAAIGQIFFGLSSDTGAYNAATDRLLFGISVSGSTKNLRILATDGAAIGTTGTGDLTTLASATTYYFKMIRDSATSFTVKIYSDSAFTTLVETSTVTIPATIINLRYAHVYTYDSCTSGNLVIQLDDLEFYNATTIDSYPASNVYDGNTSTRWTSNAGVNPNVYVDMNSALNLCAVAFYWDGTNTTETSILIQTSINASTWVTKRTVTTSGLTSGAWNYYRFNIAAGHRYVRFYGNSGSSLVLSIYEVKVLTKTDTQIFADLGILEISTTSTSLTAAGT